MRRRFFWGMVAVAVVTLTVGGTAAAVLVNNSVESSIRSEFERQALATARIIESEVGPGRSNPDSGGRARIGDVLRVVRLVGGHEYVEAAVVGPRGAVTVIGDEARLTAEIEDIGDLVRPRIFDAEIDGVAVTALAQPFALGEDRGTLVVTIGTRLEVVPWGGVLLRLLLALGVGLVLAGLLAWSLTRFAGRRLQGMATAADEVSRGNLEVRVEADGGDELADLASAFNLMTEELGEARRREREFLVSVGHELRTPLTTIAGYAEAIEDGRITGSDLDRVAGVLGVESSRLHRLIDDLMLLSRIEAREFGLRPEDVDVLGHIAGVVEGLREKAASAGVTLELETGPSGPTASIDPDRLAQIAVNLIENALRYTPETGRVSVRVEVDDEVHLTVSDTGPGIAASDLPRVFERLYVANRYRAVRPEGSGLGLSIVRELVDAMGGSVAVASSESGGTRFEVILPAGSRG